MQRIEGRIEHGIVGLVVLPRPIRLTIGVPQERTADAQPTGIVHRGAGKVEVTMGVQLQDNQEVDLSADIRDAAGNPTKAASLSWASSDESVLTLRTGDDPAQVTAVSTGSLGVATVTVSDDEDGDPSTAEFLGSLSFEIVSGPVAQISVSAGTPRDKA